MVHQISAPPRDVIPLSRKSRPRAYPHIRSWGTLKEEAQRDSLPSPKSSPKFNHPHHRSPVALGHQPTNAQRHLSSPKLSQRSPPNNRSESRRCDFVVASAAPALGNCASNRENTSPAHLKNSTSEKFDQNSKPSCHGCLRPSNYSNSCSSSSGPVPAFPGKILAKADGPDVQLASCTDAISINSGFEPFATEVSTRKTVCTTQLATTTEAGQVRPSCNSYFNENDIRGLISTSFTSSTFHSNCSSRCDRGCNCGNVLASLASAAGNAVTMSHQTSVLVPKLTSASELCSSSANSGKHSDSIDNGHSYNSLKNPSYSLSFEAQQRLQMNPKSPFQSNELLECPPPRHAKLAQTVSLDLLLGTNCCGYLSPNRQERLGLNSTNRGHSNLTHPLPRQQCRGQRPRASCIANPSSKSSAPYQLVPHASRLAPKCIINGPPKLQQPPSLSGFAPPPGTPGSSRAVESSPSSFPLFSSISQGYRTKDGCGLRSLHSSENNGGIQDPESNDVLPDAHLKENKRNALRNPSLSPNCTVGKDASYQQRYFSAMKKTDPQLVNEQALPSVNLQERNCCVDTENKVRKSSLQNCSARFSDVQFNRDVSRSNALHHDCDSKTSKKLLPNSPSFPRKTYAFPPCPTVAFSRSDTFSLNDSPNSRGDVCLDSECLEERGREIKINTSQVYYDDVVVSRSSTSHQLLPSRPFGALDCQNKSYLKSEQFPGESKKGTGSENAVSGHRLVILPSKRSRATRPCEDHCSDRRFRYGRFFADDRSSGMSSDCDASRERTPLLRRLCTTSHRTKLRKSRAESALMISTSSEEGISPVRFKADELISLQEGTKGGKAGLRKSSAESADTSSPRSKHSVSADDCSNKSLSSVSSASLTSALPVLKSSNENKKTSSEPKAVNELKKSTNDGKKAPFDSSKKALVESKQTTTDGGKPTGEPRRFTSEAAKRLSEAGRKPNVVADQSRKNAAFNTSDSAVSGSRKSPSKLDGGERVRGRSVSSKSCAGAAEAKDHCRRPSAGQKDSRRAGIGGKLSTSLPRYSGSSSAPTAAAKSIEVSNKSTKDDKFSSKRVIDVKGNKGNGPSHRIGGRTATVTPSEVTINKRPTLKPLTRFGFNDASVRSSDSTESINSILSDANTVSDSNSNILEFYDEHPNVNGERGFTNSELVHMKNLKNNLSVGDASVNSSQDVIIHCAGSPKSPTSISQTSSGVTSSVNAVTARLKAQSRLLPQPQLPAVKSLHSSQANKSLKSTPKDTNTSTAGKNVKKTVSLGQNDSFNAVNTSSFLPQPSSTSKASQNLSSCPVTFKAVTSGLVKSATPSPVEEKENASPKSVTTVDSGLGSSMEGDKLKAVEKSQDRFETSRQRTPSVGRSTEAIAALQSQLRNASSQLAKPSSFNGRLDVVVPASESVQMTPSPESDSMKSSIIDESDKWLREKKNRMGKASKLQTGSLLKPATKLRTVFSCVETSASRHKVNQSSCDTQPSEHLSDEKDTYLSYGAVRQKFAVYDRTPSVQKQEASRSFCSNQTEKIKLHKSPSDPGRALHELHNVGADSKLPQIHCAANNRVTNIRPTSLVKNPILVTPVSNEVVELSKPILKRLEYTEGNSTQTGHAEFAAGKRMTHRKSSTEDLLMVSCTELQGKDPSQSNEANSKTTNDSRDIEFNKKLNHKSSAPSFNVLESPTLEIVAPGISSSKLSVLSLESPSGRIRDENKVSSPGSETSFEVLDTPSEGLEDPSVCNFVSYQDPRGEEDATQDLRQQMMDLQCHQIGPEALGSHSSEERALIDSFIGNIQPETDCNDGRGNAEFQEESLQENNATCETIAASMNEEKLASSLEKSVLVESLTNAVMSESLEESATASMNSSITSHEVAYTNDPSPFYNLTTTSLSLPESGDKEQPCENKTTPGKTESAAEVQNFMNNLMNSKLEIVEIINNLTPTHRDDSTAINENESTQDKESTPNSSKDSVKFVQTDLNLSTIDKSESNPDTAQTTCAEKPNETEGKMETRARDSELLLNTSTDSGPLSCTTPTTSRRKQSGVDSFSNGANSSGVDMDQDFLIDDEISDQPDLTFIGGEDACTDRSDLGFGSENLHFHGPHQRSGLGINDYNCERNKSSLLKNTASSTPQDQERSSGRSREEMTVSVASDEGVFGDDLEAPSPCHAVRRIGRAVSEAEDGSCAGAGGRPDSVCTLASSLDPDDFMLDFDVDDFSTNGCATPSGGVKGNSCLEGNLRGNTSTNSSLHSSPHHYSTKRSARNDSAKPTRLPVLRPQTDEQGGVMDRTLQQQLLQDCHATKAMLLQLRTVLLNSESGAAATSFVLTNKSNEDATSNSRSKCGGGLQNSADVPPAQSLECLIAQNDDLRRQIAQLQQQMEERDKTVRSLQSQLNQTSGGNIHGLSNKDLNNQRLVRSLVEPGVFGKNNAATQTDRTGRVFAASSLTRQPSVDDGLGPTVSSEESDCATPSRSRSLSRTSCVGAGDLCSSDSNPDPPASKTTPPSKRSSPFTERSVNFDRKDRRVDQKERSAVFDRKEKLPVLDKAHNRMIRSTPPRGKSSARSSNDRDIKTSNSSSEKRISGAEMNLRRGSSIAVPDVRNSDASFKTFQERKEIFSLAHSPARNSSATRSS